jgi:hypothetical protein
VRLLRAGLACLRRSHAGGARVPARTTAAALTLLTLLLGPAIALAANSAATATKPAPRLLGYLTTSSVPGLKPPTHEPWQWDPFADHLDEQLGIVLLPLPPLDEHPADLLVLSQPTAVSLDGEGLDALAARLASGAMLFLDQAGSNDQNIESTKKLADDLANRLDLEWTTLPAEHPLITGAFPGGLHRDTFEPGRWATAAMRDGPPPIDVLEKKGRLLAIYVRFDLIDPANGRLLFESACYRQYDSETLLRNIIVFAYHQRARADVAASAATEIPTRSCLPLTDLSATLLSRDDLLTAAQTLAVAHREQPAAPEVIDARRRIEPLLAARYRALAQAGQADDVQRYRSLFDQLGLAPPSVIVAAAPEGKPRPDGSEKPSGSPVATEDPAAPSEPKPSKAPTPNEHAPSAKPAPKATPAPGSTTGTPQEAKRFPELPEKLSLIKLVFFEQPTNAYLLLEDWFRWEEEVPKFEAQLIELEEELLDLNNEMHRVALEALRDGRSSSARGELDRLRAEREDLEEKRAEAAAHILLYRDRQRQLDEVLLPVADRLATFDITREGKRWILKTKPR